MPITEKDIARLLDWCGELTKENAKLRRVAEAACEFINECIPFKGPERLDKLLYAVLSAGYPKSSTTQATEDKT